MFGLTTRAPDHPNSDFGPPKKPVKDISRRTRAEEEPSWPRGAAGRRIFQQTAERPHVSWIGGLPAMERGSRSGALRGLVQPAVRPQDPSIFGRYAARNRRTGKDFEQCPGRSNGSATASRSWKS